MSNLNTTVSSSAIRVADKSAKVKESREVTQDISSVVLKDAVRAVKDTDSANFAFCTSLTVMCLDSLSRKVARSEEFKPGKDGKVSPTITKSNGDVLFALMVRSVYLGLPVFLDTAAHVADIAAMGHATKPNKDAKVKAARDYVDGTWTLNGQMLPLNVDPTKDTSGQYVGAKRKAMVSSFATARRMSSFLVAWFWNNRSDVIRDFGGRNLTGDDVEMVRAIIRDTFGDTFAALESAYRLGRPAPKPRAELLERVKTATEKATIEEVQALAAYFQAKFSQMAAAQSDAEAATGLDNVDSLDALFGDDDAEAIAA